MPVCSWPGKDGKPLRFDSEKLRDIKFVSRGQSSTALHLPWPSGSLSHPSDLAIVLSVLADLSRLLGVPFDLSSSDMSHADLGFADFRGADLHGAAMIGTDLHQADLRKANLRNANLAGARLDEADLTGASAREARLSYAYLVDANLTGVDFRWAHLTNAKLTRSKCAGAGFLDADLSSADLGEANLFEADLRGVDMRNASLLRANLRDVEFDRGRFINPVLRVIPGPLARLFFEPEYRSRFLGVMIDEAYGSWRFMHFVRYRVAVESTQSLWPKWWLTATKHFCGMGHRLSNLIAWAALVVLLFWPVLLLIETSIDKLESLAYPPQPIFAHLDQQDAQQHSGPLVIETISFDRGYQMKSSDEFQRFSLANFLTVGLLPYHATWWLAQWTAGLQAMLGLFFYIMLIFTVNQKFRSSVA